jgi:putative transposase
VSEVDGKKVSEKIAFRYNLLMQEDRFIKKSCKRYNIPGHAHELTFSCYKNQKFLLSDRTCQWLIDSIEKAREKHNFSLWAFVFMPDHVHLLIKPMDEDYNISNILKDIKTYI